MGFFLLVILIRTFVDCNKIFLIIHHWGGGGVKRMQVPNDSKTNLKKYKRDQINDSNTVPQSHAEVTW